MEERLGKYEILEVLGSGSMAVVYKARDSVLQRLVALKVLNERLPQGEESSRERFLNEARIAAGLTHPNIVVIHELGVEADQPYIAMELLEGRDLKDLFAENYPFNMAQKLHIALQVAKALQHAHSHDVIHRNIKPANIHVLEDDSVKLVDFSIAKLVTEEQGDLTRRGIIAGDISYMSPEQIRGEPLTTASDVFSYGTVLYELFTYTKLFDAQNESVVAFQILAEDEPVDLERVPEGLRELLDGCLKRSPADRTDSFELIVGELTRIKGLLGSDRLTHAAAADREPPAAAPVRSRPGPAVIGPVRPEPEPDVPPKIYLQRPAAPSPVLRHRVPEYRPPPRSWGSSLALSGLAALVITVLASAAIIVLEPRWLGEEGLAAVRMVKIFVRGLLPSEPPAVPLPAPTPDARPQSRRTATPRAGGAARPPGPLTPTPTAVAAGTPPAAPTAGPTLLPAPAVPDIAPNRWAAGKPALVSLPGGASIEMVWIAGGEFQMGCSADDDECSDDEKPVHTVALSGFWLGKYELTQAQWTAVMGSNPSDQRGDSLPVGRVAWVEAQDFLKRAGQELRLPTEAEWEYAARAGSATRRYGPLDEIAWYSGNSGSEPHPVGQKPPNALGLHDMLGNAWEWCDDRFGAYPADRVQNPRSTDGEYGLSRGGSYSRAGRYARVSARYGLKPGFSSADVGFRVARSGPKN